MVLSPFLFTLYTSDFRFSSQSCHLQKFSDDSASRGQEKEYRSVVDRGTEVDIVDSDKYLGVHLDNKSLVLSQVAQIFQRLQDHAVDFLSLGGIQHHLLHCSVLGH
ncbi:hypothetical protein L3Q82_006469 [Scortum barcoo]|uniref:Uncharacterized protein n=1 Tax=Scortum barcoo TaxID=214431 RepID=A0ACB8WZD0_9TELE|nr:hypothetical protein L3Q82_006469 [Scortum barcoo]